MSERDVIIGVTGASGAIYARALVRELLSQDLTVHFIPTAHASVVWQGELGDVAAGDALAEGETAPRTSWDNWLAVPAAGRERLVVYDDTDIAAAPASGTFRARAMVVVPCSMNTLAKVAHGISDTLLTRAAAARLKERQALILVPRETPLSLADCRNLTAAAEAGAAILPAAPGFYHRPTSIGDLVHFLVSKICDQLGAPCAASIRYKAGNEGKSV